MALSQDIKERIFAAANALHTASKTGEFPNVEAVRQESRAGMNNVVEAMKEWRQNQRKQVQVMREPLPAELHSVVQRMGQSLWETAQQLANESLAVAKVAFETEKSDLIQLSSEQSAAFETQTHELETAQARIAELEQQAQNAVAAAMVTAQQLEETRSGRIVAEQQTALAKQKAEEIERWVTELRADVDRLRTERDKAQQRYELANAENVKLADRLGIAQEQIVEAQVALTGVTAKAEAAEQVHAEQRRRADEEIYHSAERITNIETERDKARTEASIAREEVATLRGQLESTKTQNADLLAALRLLPAVKSPKISNNEL